MNERRPIITLPPSPEQGARNVEMRRRAEVRHTYLVPLYVMTTGNVPPPEAQAALQGVVDAVYASGQDRQVINFGSSAWSAGAYSSPDWYIAEAYRRQSLRRNAGFGPQIATEYLTALMEEEPWQENPHWDVSVVNHDLNAKHDDGRYVNFVFGETDTSVPSSVQSVTRFIEEVQPGTLRQAMVRRLLRHEVGHMFGLPSGLRGRNLTEYLGTHCTNPCTMRQGGSIEAWKKLTHEEESMGIHFCGDCMQDLAKVRKRFRPLP